MMSIAPTYGFLPIHLTATSTVCGYYMLLQKLIWFLLLLPTGCQRKHWKYLSLFLLNHQIYPPFIGTLNISIYESSDYDKIVFLLRGWKDQTYWKQRLTAHRGLPKEFGQQLSSLGPDPVYFILRVKLQVC